MSVEIMCIYDFHMCRPGAGSVALQTLDWSDAAKLSAARYDVLLVRHVSPTCIAQELECAASLQ